jgi:hypothetical protein
MSYENPTRLRIGMHANFGGKNYRLIGRVVLGVTDDGETYYWNEFNLDAQDGTFATLVYEETERGGEWRLFTMFDPEYPMTTADAATKCVGDPLNLTGTDVRVTLLDTSRVYRIEGLPPEGLKVGDVANYFNAEAGDIMQVVSWTGDEVEFYNGVNLSSGVVNSAFNLPPEPSRFGAGKIFSSLSGSDSGGYDSGVKFAMKAVGIIVLFFVFFGRGLSCSTNYEAAPVNHISAGTAPLVVGATGNLSEKNYRITTHVVVEVAEMGQIYERHEYELTDDYGMIVLLVCGDKPNTSDWLVFEPMNPMISPTAKQAAAKQLNDLLELDGFTGRVSEIFRSTIKQSDGEGITNLKNGNVFYGLGATSEHQTLLARWNSEGITYFRGRSLPSKKLLDCFTATKGMLRQNENNPSTHLDI